MADETKNRQLHELLGRHVCKDFSVGFCVKCKEFTWPNGVPIPDYCSPDSPRKLLDEVEKGLLDSDPSCALAERYVIALCKAVGIDTRRWERTGPDGWRTVPLSPEDAFCLATASEKERVTAMIEVLNGK